MATLVKQDGRYYLQFYELSRSPQRKKVPLKTGRKGPALSKQRELEDAYIEGRFDPWRDDPFNYGPTTARKLSLGEACQQFQAKKSEDKRTENTIRTYREVLSLFARVVNPHTLLDDIDARSIYKFIQDPSVSPATRNKRYGHLRTFYRWCIRGQLIGKNPLAEIQAPARPAKLPKAITESELRSLCTALRLDYEQKLQGKVAKEGDLVWRIPLFWFVYYTGMRASELAELRWEHIDQDKGLIYIYKQKNRKEQTIPLNRKAKEVLNQLRPGCEMGYVFISPRSKFEARNARYFRERASRSFREARKAAKLNAKLSFHSLRHGFCTRLAEAGKPLYVIKEAARHADVSTSMIYVHMANTHLKAELDEVFC